MADKLQVFNDQLFWEAEVVNDGLRIFILDSDPAGANSLAAIVQQAGHLLVKDKPDLIFLAWNGDEASVAEVVAAHPFRPVILAVTPALMPQAADWLGRGVARYVLYPYRPGEIATVLQTFQNLVHLQAEQANLHHLIAQAPDAIIRSDARGNIIEYNAAAQRLLGYTPEQAHQMHVSQLYAEALEGARQVFRAADTTPQKAIRYHDTHLRDAYGQLIPIRMAAVLNYNGGGQLQDVFGYFRDLREIQILDELTQSLNGVPQEGVLLERIISSLVYRFQAEAGLILRYSNRSNRLKVEATCHLPNFQTGYDPNEGLPGRVFNANAAYRPSKSEIANDLFCQSLVTIAIESLLLVPLTVNEEPFGLLVLLNKQGTGEQFSVADENLLASLSNQVVGLIQHARYREWLEALFKAGSELVAIQDQAKALQKVVSMLVDVLDYRSAYFRTADEQGTMHIRAAAGIPNHHLSSEESAIPAGKGITGRVIATKQPISTRDWRNAPDFYFRHRPDRQSLTSMLVVPLLHKGEALGTLTGYTCRPHTFSQEEIHLVRIFANLAVAIIQNTDLIATTRRGLRELQQLEQAVESLAAEVKLDKVLFKIASNIPLSVNCQGAYVASYDPTNRRFDLGQAIGFKLGHGVNVWEEHQPRPGNVIEHIFRDKEAVIADVASPESKRWLGAAPQAKLLATGIQAFIGLNLAVGDHPAGILFVNYDKPLPISGRDDTLATLRIYAAQAAIAIERATLFERLEQEQKLIQSVTKAMTPLHDVEKTWQAILLGAMRLTKAERGNISIIQQASQKLVHFVNEGFPPSYEKLALPLNDHYSIQGWVAIHKEPVLIHDIQTDTSWKAIYYEGVPDTRSEVTVPIFRGDSDNLAGIINLESPRLHAFTPADLRLLQALAIHADIVVQNAQVRRDLEWQQDGLDAYYAASTAIAQASLQPQEVLETILNQAVKVTGCDFGTIHLIKGDLLEFEVAYPAGRLTKLHTELGHGLPLSGRGITVRAVNHNQAQLVPDVSQDPDFVDATDQNTGCELAVPLCTNNTPIGVLNVEHRHKNALQEKDKRLLVALGEVASAALRNARHHAQLEEAHQELERTKQQSATRLALARIAGLSSTNAHAIGRLAIAIQNANRVLKDDQATFSKHWQTLSRINSQAHQIYEKAGLLDIDLEPDKAISLLGLLTNRFRQWQRKHPATLFELGGQLDETLIVRVTKVLLEEALDIVIENGVAAMEDQEERRIVIDVKYHSQHIHLFFSDNGPGFPPEKIERVGREPFHKKSNEQGSGLGLLIAATVIEAFGGSLRALPNQPQGATILITLPQLVE